MKKIMSLVFIVGSGCATSTPPVQTVQKMIAAGEAKPLGYVEYAEMVVGNTIVGESGSATYYRDDGVKLVKLPSGELVSRVWNRNDAGVLCHTLVKSNEMSCFEEGGDMQIAINEKVIYLYSRNKHWAFDVTEGNSANLSE